MGRVIHEIKKQFITSYEFENSYGRFIKLWIVGIFYLEKM